MKVIELDIKNKIGVTNWKTDGHENAHITVKPDICNTCPDRLCISGCPTECFKFYVKENGKEEISFQYEDCVECGMCAITCRHGSVTWNNPRGTYGVTYSQG